MARELARYDNTIKSWLLEKPALQPTEAATKLRDLGANINPADRNDTKKVGNTLAILRRSLGLRAVIAASHCVISVGIRHIAKQRKRRLVEGWDAKTAFHLANHLGASQAVFQLDPASPSGAAEQRFRDLKTEYNCVLTIGAPTSNVLSELALSAIFKVPAFAKAAAVKRPPIRFCWPPGFAPFRSHFITDARDLPDSFGEKPLVVAGTGYAIQVDGDTWHYVGQNGGADGETNDFGFIAAAEQRGEDDATPTLLVVVAGASGPGTYWAANRLVSDGFINQLHKGKVLLEAVRVRVNWGVESGGTDGDDTRSSRPYGE